MKKIFAALMIAAFVLSTGCGNKVEETAKDAQQKVEQKADEMKSDAEKKADEMKSDAEKKADEMKSDAEKKADEMKSDAEKKADEMKSDVEKKADEMKSDAEKKADEMKSDAEKKVGEVKADAEQKLDAIKAGVQKMREVEDEISLGGIFPGVTVDDVKAAYGEPLQTNGEELVFENGAIVNVDTNNMVKSIRMTTPDVETPAGVAVGMSEYVLNDAYGAADKVKKLADGAEYEYDRGADKIARLVFTAKNGLISEIKTEFNK